MILSKARSRPAIAQPRRQMRGLGAEWKIAGYGFATAVVLYAISFTRFVCSAIVTLFHEFGHAVAGWIMGYPSLPAFDLIYGGGVTQHGEFRTSLAIAIAAVFVVLTWRLREMRKAMIVIAVVFLVWLLLVTREWRRDLIIATAGHISELTLAGVFLYKALTGAGLKHPDLERPLNAVVAFFVQINSFLFARRLLHDPEFLSWYREGKGGAIMNDLESIALSLQIWLAARVEIDDIARLLMWLSVAPAIVAIACYLTRERMEAP